MKKFDEIYNSLINNFKDKTKLDIAFGSTLDSFYMSTATGIKEAYDEIERNKNPHIYTNLKGSDIDGVGMLVGCLRLPEEDDTSYLYRVLNWNTSNQTSNSTAIETATMNMQFASNVSYVPYTQGVATGTAYIIPKKLDKDTIDKAIKETKERLKKVVSPSSYIQYLVPEILYVDIVAYLSIYKDEENVKNNISKKFENYINNIAPGDKMEIGQLNKIGINEPNVGYFSISNIIIDNKEIQDIEIIQKLEKKLVFNKVIWNMVV